jgi:hypothetical protein
VEPGCAKPGNSEATISAGAAEGADRERKRSVGARLLQVVQERDSVIEPAIETAAFMPDSDKSRGYCLEMICADFLAGANLDNQNPETLLFFDDEILQVPDTPSSKPSCNRSCPRRHESDSTEPSSSQGMFSCGAAMNLLLLRSFSHDMGSGLWQLD